MHKQISFWKLAILCYFLTVAIAWSYGNSFIIYAITSILLAAFVFWRFFFKKDRINSGVKTIVGAVLLITLYLGIVNGDLQSSIMVNMSLLMPFALASIDIDYNRFTKQTIIASVVNLLLINVLISNTGAWNSNSLAFVIFCGLSVGMMWFKTGAALKSRFFSTSYLVLGSSFLFMTGCRNAGIVIIACYILLILPDRIYKSGLFFRILYAVVLLTTVFAADFMYYVLTDERIMSQILAFTTSFSEKAWGMDTHYMVLEFIKTRLAEMDIFSLLFGAGVKSYHCHNLFYQCVLFYGYIGTAVIYLLYIYIFERAYKLFKCNNDVIALSCYIILIGHFMLQIGEVYMLGAETVVIMALLPAGIILQRWNKYIESYC